MHNGSIETTVYRKDTNTDVYINWKSHTPIQWRIATLRNLIQRSIMICSNKYLLEKEIDHLRNVFVKINDFPYKVVNDIMNEELKKKNNKELNIVTENHSKENTEQIQLLLPFSGNQGSNLLTKMKKELKKHLPNNVKTLITYEGTKLSTKFQVKDKTKFEHRHNITYYSCCPNINCSDSYVGETERRIKERIIDHNKRDKKSHLLKHARENGHNHVWKDDFKILNSNYRNSIKRKISEALYIRQLKPTLNVKEKSIKLNLYN